MQRSIHILRKALFAGIMLGTTTMVAHADSYEDGLVAYTNGNFALAGQQLMIAAEKGNTGAEHLLMKMFSEGHLTAENQEKEILKWTRKAAENGIKQAQYGLGELYAKNPETMTDAVKWFRQAADQGHPDAYYKLGEILKDGAKGVESNSGESVRMFQIAASEYHVFAQMGNPEYQLVLGLMYQDAKGVSKDMDIALKWINKSAMQGHALAQIALGRIYAQGIEVPRDIRQARYWLDMAAAQGHQDAIVALAELETTVAFAL